MEILIAGGGVGGLALARGLAGSGHRVRVLEAAPALRTGGAAFTVFSNGAAALAGLGVPPGDFGGRLDRLRFDTADGATMVDADLADVARRTGFPVVSTPRARLIEHLAEGVDVVFSREVVDVEVRPDGVTAIDATGARHDADVVVGADGHRSAVRRAVLDPAPAAENEWTTWQGLTRVLPELAGGTTGVCVVGRAGLVGMLPSGDGLLQWWFDVDGPLSGPPAAALAARFTGYGPLVSALVEQIRDADLESFRHVTHRIPDRWGRGGATLLGDAAHAFPPTQAQGANQALEDAWVLSRILRAGPASPAEALRRYERLRAPRVRKVSRRAVSERTNKPMPAPVRLLLGLLPRAVVARAYAAQLRGVSSVLHGEV
ncbi:NAD(P)/FAD-dependent oxidoreductase [Catellatospora sp. NPDC049609]|uniref:FAD-dependent oxidoreductase n=1 Tax=Catellatospora sp. NPDC049609 TaxID=3155505 RepID=UPI0034358ABF